MRKVAIVGVEGSGKTVMLAGLGDLYTHPDEGGYFLAPKNFGTAAYVAEKIERMRKGEWPSATAGDEMQGLDWTLKRREPGARKPPEKICEVSFLDFAGEVYRTAYGISGAGDASLKEQAEALKQYVCGADDLIVLINLRDVITNGLRDKRVQEAMWITKSILDTALGDGAGEKPPRAAIVLSQADSYAETIKVCRGPQGVLAKYLPHVANNYSWLDILAASAVDKTILDDNGNQVPAPDFQSQKLRVIMDWIRDGLEGVKKTSTIGSASVPKTPPLSIWRHFSFKGRQNRVEYWKSLGCLFGSLMILGGFIGLLISLEESGMVGDGGFFLCVGVPGVAIFVFLLSNIVRRLHDFNLSWGWLFVFFIPPFWIQLIIIGLIKGTDGDNDYGPKP